MFTTIPLKHEESLQENGKLLLLQDGENPSLGRARVVPHKIVFQRRADYGEWPLFLCNVTITRTLFILDELCKDRAALLDSGEAPDYFFTGWVVSEAQRWAAEKGKLRVLIYSSLPHIAEFMFIHKFELSNYHSEEGVGYRGYKEL